MKPSWLLKIATNTEDRLLNWQPFTITGVQAAFIETERKQADNMAIDLQALLGDKALVRVRHRLPNRGGFMPAPRPARRLS